jgi:S1-C subfamily serine protease
VRGTAHAFRFRLRALSALVVAVALLAPVQPVGVGSKPAKKAAALPASQLLRDNVLGDLLSGLLPGLFPAPTPPAGALPPSVVQTVSASTVKVGGVACGVRVEGSGFSIAPDTVVTNAHVVAGVSSPQVLRPDGRRLPARVEAFDPDRDLALLAVPDLRQQPLPVASAAVGDTGAVFGHPWGRVPVEMSPAVVTRRVDAEVDNIYGQGPVSRRILVLRSHLEPGDSGGPLVNQSGSVVGVAFGISVWSPRTAFAVASEELASVLARPRTGAVSTGACLP